MEQVRELLDLIKGMEINGKLVATSFIVRRVQPCKERAHPGFDFKGDDDDTRERMGRLTRDDVVGTKFCPVPRHTSKPEGSA